MLQRYLNDLLKGIALAAIFLCIFVYLPITGLASATGKSAWSLIWWPWGPYESDYWPHWLISPAITVMGVMVAVLSLNAATKMNPVLGVVVLAAVFGVLLRFLWSIFTLMGLPLLVVGVITWHIHQEDRDNHPFD